MKKILIIFLISIIILVFIAAHNNNPRVIISNLIKKGDIETGELRYLMYFFGVFPVGEAVFAVEKIEEYEGQRVYHLNATAQSSKFFSKFYSSLAVLDSYIDIQQLNPAFFKQKMRVTGKQGLDKEVIYDQKDGIMILAGTKRKILPNTQDPLSAVFNIRRMDFNKIKDFQINLNTNQKNYILKGNATVQDILINKKTYKIVLVKTQIARRDKNPYHKSSITMVFLQGKENIPILIKVFASGVSINAKLIDIK